jgi:hypothetical protein
MVEEDYLIHQLLLFVVVVLVVQFSFSSVVLKSVK